MAARRSKATKVRHQRKPPQRKKHGRCRDKVVVVRPHSRSPRGPNTGKSRPRVRPYKRSRPC